MRALFPDDLLRFSFRRRTNILPLLLLFNFLIQRFLNRAQNFRQTRFQGINAFILVNLHRLFSNLAEVRVRDERGVSFFSVFVTHVDYDPVDEFSEFSACEGFGRFDFLGLAVDWDAGFFFGEEFFFFEDDPEDDSGLAFEVLKGGFGVEVAEF